MELDEELSELVSCEGLGSVGMKNPKTSTLNNFNYRKQKNLS